MGRSRSPGISKRTPGVQGGQQGPEKDAELKERVLRSWEGAQSLGEEHEVRVGTWDWVAGKESGEGRQVQVRNSETKEG